MPILQVISTSPLDSLIIQKAGADRIELVSALQIGGITPSATIIRKSIQCVDIPTMVMIRHHNNGFVHSQSQIQLFCQQATDCIQMGVKGIVFGGTTDNNQLDLELISKIKEQIGTNKIDITFHKAFDQVSDIVKSYQKLNQSHVTRVLTQGGQKPILQNLKVLHQIVEKSKYTKGTKVLLGGGISLQNVNTIIEKTNAQEIHIGTCVRKNKYGPVLQEKVSQFMQKIRK